jgi:hypothetical protein
MFVIRTGAEEGLIQDVARFRDYRDLRNVTSHTYNSGTAERVIAALPDFIDDVRYLLNQLACAQ